MPFEQEYFEPVFQNDFYPYPYTYMYEGDYYRQPMSGIAHVRGGPQYPAINGTVTFRNFRNGTMVYVEINGLPQYQPGTATTKPIGPFGFHIHQVGDCTVGNPATPFTATGEHYNPTNQPHGNHAGDMPVLFSNHGFSYMVFFTERFRVRDIIGKSVVIHENPDDFITQPAGGSGRRIACGVITETR